jgi:hypothetical protein
MLKFFQRKWHFTSYCTYNSSTLIVGQCGKELIKNIYFDNGIKLPANKLSATQVAVLKTVQMTKVITRSTLDELKSRSKSY